VVLALFVGLAVLPTQAEASYTIYDNTAGSGPLGYGNATSLPLTMAQLQAGYYIVADDKVFYNFSGYSAAASAGSPTLLAASAISITPILTSNPPPGSGPGLDYQGAFQVNAGQKEDIKWSYTVKTLSGAPLIEDSSLSLGGPGFTDSNSKVDVTEGVSDQSGNLLAPLQTFVMQTAGNVFDIKFYNPVSVVNVTKDIELDASGSTGIAPTGFTFMDQRFSEVVPEPSSLAIAGLGALGLIGYGLRRRKALGA